MTKSQAIRHAAHWTRLTGKPHGVVETFVVLTHEGAECVRCDNLAPASELARKMHPPGRVRSVWGYKEQEATNDAGD